MLLSSITVNGFRSFVSERTFQFDPRFTLIIGPNSVGKTNLLEAIYLISKTQGFREKKLLDLVNASASEAKVSAHIERGENSEDLMVRLSRQDEEVTKLQYINGLHKPLKTYRTRSYNVVLFQPDDLLLVSGSASLRRQYVDRLLSGIDYEYYRARTNYDSGVYKRNKILENKDHYGLKIVAEMLQFWDDYLLKQINYLTHQRQQLVDFLNSQPELNGLFFEVEYQPVPFVNSRNQDQLAHELRVRRTLTGPALDDFIFFRRIGKERKNLASFGSRSEQRLGVLWLKISELAYFRQHQSEPPILLMDDIFSELDLANSERILEVAEDYQTIVTTAHLDVLPLLSKSHHEHWGEQITLSP